MEFQSFVLVAIVCASFVAIADSKKSSVCVQIDQCLQPSYVQIKTLGYMAPKGSEFTTMCTSVRRSISRCLGGIRFGQCPKTSMRFHFRFTYLMFDLICRGKFGVNPQELRTSQCATNDQRRLAFAQAVSSSCAAKFGEMQEAERAGTITGVERNRLVNELMACVVNTARSACGEKYANFYQQIQNQMYTYVNSQKNFYFAYKIFSSISRVATMYRSLGYVP